MARRPMPPVSAPLSRAKQFYLARLAASWLHCGRTTVADSPLTASVACEWRRVGKIIVDAATSTIMRVAFRTLLA
jgi:hypothetical protein